MTFKRSDNLREGAGGEYASSEEGGGLIEEMGFVSLWLMGMMGSPTKIKFSVCYQWTVGNGIYLRIFEVGEDEWG